VKDVASVVGFIVSDGIEIDDCVDSTNLTSVDTGIVSISVSSIVDSSEMLNNECDIDSEVVTD